MPVFDAVRPIIAGIAQRFPVPSLDISRVTVTVRDLPEALNGFTIAQVSDIHVGEGDWGPQQLQQASDVIRRESPAIVVNTGDFLDREPPLGRVQAMAGHLTVSGEDRNFAVLGNHDYNAGDEIVVRLKQELGAAGIRVLENELVCIHRGDAGLTLAGLEPEAPGWEEAIQTLAESGRPRVVLMHVPDCAVKLPPGIADLILTGHTHGGQIAFPGLEKQTVRKMCGSDYVEGMYEINGSRVYVNRGLGCVGLPMRFRANPEVAFLTLSR